MTQDTTNHSPFRRTCASEEARVVVTGVGAVTPIGLTAEESWKNALSGVSGIAPITRFNAEKFDVKFAGEVKNFNPDLYINKKDIKKMDLFIQYSLAASKMALNMAGLQFPFSEEKKHLVGSIVGVGLGGIPFIEEQIVKCHEKGPSRYSPFFIPATIGNLASGQISIETNAGGPNYSVTSACASGAHSIGEAVQYIRRGICDVMIAGGAEGAICSSGVGGFAAMRALSTRNDSPQTASRPWDKSRDGFVMAEGAGTLILESLEHAKKRNANILCEIVGYGVSSDAYHMTSPTPDGSGAGRAIELCLKDAKVHGSKVNYINAHGTSTPVGDAIESLAIKRVFKEHAKALWISSTKSMTGHTLGAAGAIESVFCVLALRDQIAPPTINLENPSEDCDLDYVPHKAREGKISYILNNSFGFGGTNACLLFTNEGI